MKLKFVEKKLISIILTIIMVLALLSAMPQIVQAEAYGDFEYFISNNEITITKYNGYTATVDIPATINGMPVTKIGNRAFEDCQSLTKVIIPDSVTSIENRAIAGCNGLTSLIIPDSVTFIDEYAFCYNRNLKSITLPNSITHLSRSILEGCDSLTNLTIPDSVTYIGMCAIGWCKSLTTVTIPSNVNSIEAVAFGHCYNLSTAYFLHSDASTITYFGENVFINAALDFRIIYPSNAVSFTTPVWKDYPACPDSVDNVNNYIANMSDNDKTSLTAIDHLILYAENEILNSATKNITGSEITVNINTVKDLQNQSADTKNLIEQTLKDNDIDIMRELNDGIRFQTQQSKKVVIRVENSAINMAAENVEIQTPSYSVSIPKKTILSDVSSGSLIITVEEIATTAAGKLFAGLDTNSNLKHYAANTANQGQYTVTLSKDIKENATFSFDPLPGDVNYQCVTRSDGTPVGGKYNPVTKKIDVRIKRSGTYTVQENRKDFNDIANKSTEMREAIKILASKGYINGMSDATFNPDGAITRAEIAALIVRIISALDENADSQFADVKKSDWFFREVGSAKAIGLIHGTSPTMFEPRAQIKKEQIIAIAARTLRQEMNYNTPKDIDKYLKKFTDRNLLPSWGIDDFALASMCDLILVYTDGKFNPSNTMTRGEASVVLYRIFNLIW